MRPYETANYLGARAKDFLDLMESPRTREARYKESRGELVQLRRDTKQHVKAKRKMISVDDDQQREDDETVFDNNNDYRPVGGVKIYATHIHTMKTTIMTQEFDL